MAGQGKGVMIWPLEAAKGVRSGSGLLERRR